MNTSPYTVEFNGVIITVQTLDEAVTTAQKLGGSQIPKETRNGNGAKPHPAVNPMKPKRTPAHDALLLARDLLTAIRDAPKDGLEVNQAMNAVGTMDNKGFGGRIGKVNGALRDLGFHQINFVYKTEKTRRGKIRKPGRQLPTALEAVQRALSK